MHIIIGLIAGITIGALAGSAAAQLTAPSFVTVPANKVPVAGAPAVQAWDI
jgi:ABC-type xylose transport system permease subunit